VIHDSQWVTILFSAIAAMAQVEGLISPEDTTSPPKKTDKIPFLGNYQLRRTC
jgi:hypothetical protein